MSIATRAREATHVVCATPPRRTPKFLAAISVARHAVTLDWLWQSDQLGRAADEVAYAVRDPIREAAWGFDLSASLARTRAGERCLAGHALVLDHRARRPERKLKLPTDGELREIAECAGAVYLAKPADAARAARPGAFPAGVVLLGDPDLAPDAALRDALGGASIVAHVGPEELWAAILSKTLPWAPATETESKKRRQ